MKKTSNFPAPCQTEVAMKLQQKEKPSLRHFQSTGYLGDGRVTVGHVLGGLFMRSLAASAWRTPASG
jgi:hypothetical protein